MTGPGVCEVGGTHLGLILPQGGDTEANLPDWLQAILYLLGLLWCFMGVAIIADVFMGAIEMVTSKKKRVLNPKTGKETTVKVWNDTVANLTLMALGSSAPEILLNVKEIFEENFYSGKLGPMTIVGSAAFNLMCILAVCVSAIPSGESRAIKDLHVYSVTAFSSIFAYLWLLFILTGPTPNCVDVTEGVMTFLFFPILVFVAFLADIGKLPFQKKKARSAGAIADSSKEELEHMAMKVRQKYGSDLTENQIAALIDFEFSQGASHSRAYHRVNATRALFRGKTLKDEKKEGQEIAKKRKDSKITHFPVVGFEQTDYVILESQGSVKLKVVRSMFLDQEALVHFATEDGSAHETDDYVRTEGDLHFQAGETEKMIAVKVINDPDGHEETEDFFVVLSPANGATEIEWGIQKARVHIVDENHPGKIAFEEEQLKVPRPEKKQDLEITVVRKRGWDGKVNVEWCTENESAYAGADYEGGEGTLEFDHHQRDAKLKVALLPKDDSEGMEVFRVIIKDSTGKAMFDETTDGGKDQCICTVFLLPKSGAGEKHNSMIFTAFRLNHDQMRVGHAKWREQFVNAIYCNGDAEGMANATVTDWIIHIIALPWKLLFAFVPPTEYLGGWICFAVSLGAIGFVTILIGDLAALLGCSFGITPFATAITFVALGTSLPDTFASKSAAVQDETADASIGNVTGSNSVNVFLGLGLPWAVGAIYWATQGATPEWYDRYPELVARYPDGAFIVKSDGVGLSVAVFSCCSVVCLGTLALRRKVVGAELGGPDKTKYATSAFFVLLWCAYIAISIAAESA
mmetsp:Transcript_21217/g.60010  ORF Transcript_21217/g.60010 Transcript_21217/m.60010 type:complete len:804 (-) Transcript_21217:197-2608(-)